MEAEFPAAALAAGGAAVESAAQHVIETIRDSSLLGRYESETEAAFQIILIARHAEAIATVAAAGSRLYPAATTLARACFETAARVLWVLDPEDPFERERRWLSRLHEAVGHYERVAASLEAGGTDGSADRAVAAQIAQFRDAVTTALPDHVDPPDLRRLPLDQMLRDIGLEKWYLPYRLLSQYPHGTHVATGLYRRNLGTATVTGEFITPSDWKSILTVTWHSLERPTRRLLGCLGGDAEKFSRDLPRESMDRSLRALVTERT